jgi:hypothetical protein
VDIWLYETRQGSSIAMTTAAYIGALWTKHLAKWAGLITLNLFIIGNILAFRISRVVEWARGFFADPYSIRSSRISDPLPITDNVGQPVELICVERNVRNWAGAYIGIHRIPFARIGRLLSIPHDDKGVKLMSDECYRHPINLKPFTE